MRRAPLVALSLGIFLAIGTTFVLYGPALSLWIELAPLNISAPEQDAAVAVAERKPICFSVNGYARYFPGAKTDAARHFCQTIERNVSGTSDVLSSPWHAELQARAIRYAGAYNSHILLASGIQSQ